MAVPAQCENCANDPYSHLPPHAHPQSSSFSLPVVLGVLGTCSLVAFVAAILVPLARRHVHRRGRISIAPSRSFYSKVSDGDLEQDAGADADANAGGVYLPSRRPSFRHQKMLAGPDAQPLRPLLLDPLRPISALTWSDLRSRTKSPSASTCASTDSLSSILMLDDDPAAAPSDQASLATNRATTSHRSSSTRSARDRDHATGRRDELGRPVISEDGSPTRPALPSPHRSPTPPGLSSKREYSSRSTRRASLPLPITPTSPLDSTQPRATSGMPPLYAAPIPSAPSTAVATAGPAAALSRYSTSRPRTTTTQRPGMEPVLEDDAYAETRSLQLPSPPASPEQSQPHWRGIHSSVHSTDAASASSSSTRRRPSLTTSQSAPTAAMPHRPRSSTGPAIPLTAAFQTSVLRSGSQSSTATAPSFAPTHRYPSIVTTPSAASGRTRPSSVSVAITSGGGGTGSAALLSPESPEMTRPTDAFRRMSTTDIRHRRPTHAEQAQGQTGGDPPAFSRPFEAARTGTQVHARDAPYDPRTASLSIPRPSFSTPPPNPLSPPSLSPTPPRLSVHTHSMQGYAPTHTSSSSSSAHSRGPSGGPALVRRKDSPALRPIPVSALMGGPSSAGMAGMSLSGSRSRSNSVRSTRTGHGHASAHLPPVDSVTPLTMSWKGSSEEDEEGEERRR
ncbi:hypothetical protein C8Q70DRAFT_550773 [Cubamyces menziesii]|nr:hypothetical protein C8Q70DRAFT_550773 [Cubamyces menziesii]